MIRSNLLICLMEYLRDSIYPLLLLTLTKLRTHKSAFDNYAAIDIKINKELASNRIAGPFTLKPPGLILSPLAAVPKKDSSELRLIHDLSFPLGDSVNSHISRDECSVQYLLLDDCIDIILKIGKGCLISKADIKSAFRILPIAPDSYHLLGFQWNSAYFIDKSLPMGLSSACNKFELFSSAIQWILIHKLKVKHMSHILDDFMFFGAPSSRQCELSLKAFLLLSESLNIPIKSQKTVLPTTCAQLHGLEIDTLKMEIRIPDDKRQRALSLLKMFSTRKCVTLVELQSLIGTLQFLSKAIVSGRTFLRRLIDLTKGVNFKHHHIRLTNESRRDLKMWLQFVNNFNGKCLISSRHWIKSSHIKFFSDASGSGYASVNGSSWIQGAFPPSWEKVNIAAKELLPLALAFRLWAHKIKDYNIVFMVDNMSIVQILQSQTSKDPIIMSLLRPMVITAMTHNIQFYSQHIPGKLNVIPDLLSRFQIQKALTMAPWLDPTPLQIPSLWLPW